MRKINDFVLKTHRFGTNTAVYSDTTCCLIKPHIVASGMAGAIIFEIQKAGFEISAIQSVNFTKPNAEEFLEVYKGVLHEYPVEIKKN
jgi:nucleoside-diphosphate kinase